MAFLINIENIDFSKESFRLELIKSKPKPLQSMINQRIYEANREGAEEIIKYLIKLESLVKNISFPFLIDEVRYIDKELQERII